MKFFDLHCDTMTVLASSCQDLGDDTECAVTLGKARFDAYAQCFAAFLSDEYRGEAAINRWNEIYAHFNRQLELYPDRIEQVMCYADLERITAEGKIAAILTTESGAAFAGNPQRVEQLRSCGCLISTLTWNGATELAGGVYTPEVGITPVGREVVAEMERVGMVIDVSHLCDKSLDDLIGMTSKPFIATHSNSRPVCGAMRNLQNDQFLEIVRRRGLVGINFLRYFLNEQDPMRADMADVLRHIEHFLALGGEDVLAFGSDYDGANIPEGFDSLEKMRNLYAYLQLHLQPEIVEKLFFENARRFFRESF